MSVGENVCHQGGKLKYNTQDVVRNECWWSVGSDLRSVYFDSRSVSFLIPKYASGAAARKDFVKSAAA